MNCLILRRSKRRTKGNRTLMPANCRARGQRKPRPRAKAARQANNPNRLGRRKNSGPSSGKKSAPTPKPNRRLIREVLSGESRVRPWRQVPFLLFPASHDLYLGLGYQTERILRDKQRTLDKLEEATAEEKTLRSDFESQLQQSRLARSTAELGLEQPTEPPILLPADE